MLNIINDLYVKTDVLLIVDVHDSYRKNSYNSFGLHSIYGISAPDFSNRAMWKMTKVKINLITDANIHLIIEKWIRGGRCEPIYYHAKANNRYINPNFDKKRDKGSCIISLDVNSLYCTAMCKKLPHEESKFDNDISKCTIDYI